MKIGKIIILAAGIMMIMMGGLWIGQGLNLIKWPASSFMIGVPQWSLNGTGLVIVGVLFVWYSRRKNWF